MLAIATKIKLKKEIEMDVYTDVMTTSAFKALTKQEWYHNDNWQILKTTDKTITERNADTGEETEVVATEVLGIASRVSCTNNVEIIYNTSFIYFKHAPDTIKEEHGSSGEPWEITGVLFVDDNSNELKDQDIDFDLPAIFKAINYKEIQERLA